MLMLLGFCRSPFDPSCAPVIGRLLPAVPPGVPGWSPPITGLCRFARAKSQSGLFAHFVVFTWFRSCVVPQRWHGTSKMSSLISVITLESQRRYRLIVVSSIALLWELGVSSPRPNLCSSLAVFLHLNTHSAEIPSALGVLESKWDPNRKKLVRRLLEEQVKVLRSYFAQKGGTRSKGGDRGTCKLREHVRWDMYR